MITPLRVRTQLLTSTSLAAPRAAPVRGAVLDTFARTRGTAFVARAPVTQSLLALRAARAGSRATLELGAPPPFDVAAGRAVYVDLRTVDVTLTFDIATETTTGRARVAFEQLDRGCPVIDLVPNPTHVRLDGEELDPALYQRTTSPIATRVLGLELAPGPHTLEVTYDVGPSSSIRYDKHGAQFFQYASDLSPVRYAEHFQPANLEYDTYAMTLRLEQVNGDRDLSVFANGMTTKNADGSFSIAFPADYNAASFYINLANTSLNATREALYTSVDGRSIPITTYGRTKKLVEGGMDIILRTLAELERDYGPYPHDFCVAGIRADYDKDLHDNSMEYAGAVISTLSALDHEIFHQYCGRGVLPIDGNAGWLDEAMNTWRDNHYERSPEVTFDKTYARLSGFSPYHRETPQQSYRQGGVVMADLDRALDDVGGLKPLLREWFTTYRRKTVSTETFRAFITGRASASRRSLIDEIFRVKVFAGALPV